MLIFPLLLIAAGSVASSTYDPVLDPADVIVHVNLYRADHMVNSVVWDADLAAYATAWAESIASRMAIDHRSDTQYGENIALLEAESATHAVKLATDIWYVEGENYDFAAPGYSFTTGQFTQLCWADTTRVGAGVGKNGDLLFVVMNFDPPGNNPGAFEANVFPRMLLSPATPLSPASHLPQSPPPPPPSSFPSDFNVTISLKDMQCTCKL